MTGFTRGFGYAFAGLGALRRSGLKRFVMIPLAVNTLVFGAAGYYGFGQLGRFTDWLAARLPDWLDWLTWLLWPLAVLGFLAAVWILFTAVANILASPFNGLLSERVAAMEGFEQASPGGSLARDLLAAPVNEIRKLAGFGLLALPLLVVSLIPVINAAASLLWLVFGAWVLAVEYMDYPLGNQGMDFRAQKSLLRERRGLALGFGAGVLLMTAVPVLNFAAMPAAVTGATLLWLREMA
jgi:CysZ protein